MSPDRPECEGCINIYKDKGKEPPCSPYRSFFTDDDGFAVDENNPCSLRPYLMSENEEARKILSVCSSQVIIAEMSGKVIGLRLEAVEVAMRIYKVKDQIKCLEKVMWIFNKLHEDR